MLLTDEGKLVQRSTIAKQLKWRAKRAGVAEHANPAAVSYENKSLLSPHAMRRTLATRLRAQGVPLEGVAEILHHQSIDTTRNHYGFASTPQQKKIVNGLSY